MSAITETLTLDLEEDAVNKADWVEWMLQNLIIWSWCRQNTTSASPPRGPHKNGSNIYLCIHEEIFTVFSLKLLAYVAFMKKMLACCTWIIEGSQFQDQNVVEILLLRWLGMRELY